ncbi:MAG: DUF5615 family PIN-like protein [Rhizobiales bacterium]|jgi:predicted nuclease of predicted toxin-antitoxin system|nr:DUF5615 family PIN-like protein [Hyphomicrobiales bacterium]
MIKVLLDQGLPRSAAGLLREIGWDVQHVSERGMSKAEDVAILDLARQEDRVVVTLDADFHAWLAVSGVNAPSVLRVRTEGLKAEQIAALVQRVFAVAGNDLTLGAMVTVLGEKIRIKHLPIIK